MKIDALLDVDVVALQAEDEVTCLLSLTAPVPPDLADRPGETLIAVVDRSGSMGGGRLASVRAALHSLVDRLKPQDSFGVAVFDNHASVQVPTRPMRDHDLPTVHALIEAIEPGGSTDLAAGYLLGLTQARRHVGATGASVLLLSDGHANAGVTDPVQLGSLASSARGAKITTTTIGIGDGYDESLLTVLATEGLGNHRFAHTDDDAAAAVSEEAGDLLAKAIMNAMVRIRPADADHIDRIGLLHAVRRWVETDPDGAPVVVVPVGDLYAGEQRELLLQMRVPAMAALGAHLLADLAIEYVALPDLVAQQVTWPLIVNAVPGDEAAGRVPNPRVTTARLLVEATDAKRRATEALDRGDDVGAADLMEGQAHTLRDSAGRLDDATLAARLHEEADQLDKLARGVREVPPPAMAKSLAEDIAMGMRGQADAVRRQRNRGKRTF